MNLQDTIRQTLGVLNCFPRNGTELDELVKNLGVNRVDLATAFEISDTLKKLRDSLEGLELQEFAKCFDTLTADESEKLERVLTEIRDSLHLLMGNLQLKNQGTIQEVKVGKPAFQAVAKKVEDKLPQIQDILREVRRHQEMQQLREKMSGPDLNLIERAEASAKELQEQISKSAAYDLANDQIEELDQIIDRHGRWSNRWLYALVLISLIALRLVIWLVAFEDKLFFFTGPVYPQMHCDMNSGVAFYYGVGKLLIASFAIGVLLISTRMYQTHGHNLVVNEQRKLAFIAFRKMLASLPANTDAGGREQLIRTAAQSIFDHGSSGFLPKGTNEFMPLVSAFMDSSKAAKGSLP